MSERREAAWDEARRRYPPGDRQAGFVSGAAWADDNPQPRTITRHDLRAMVEAQADAGMTGGWVSLDDMMTAALATIGIGVDDCASTQEEANP